MNEDAIIAAVKALVEVPCHPERSRRAERSRLKIGIGDDAALWQPSRSHRSAISTDMLVEGVDFTRDAMSLEDAGWRAMAANLSDLAAMGARPVLATIALGLPQASRLEEVLEIYRGLADCAARYKLAIAGGDLSRSDAIVIAITVVGEIRPSNVKTRAGGRPGDVLAVTGALGAARAGLELTREFIPLEGLEEEALRAFRRPEARVAEGRFLAASRNVRAMMDLSDGLATDVRRLAAASGCGAELDNVPVAQSARALCDARKEDPLRFALTGGENFELLAAIRPRAFSHLAARYKASFGRELAAVGVLRGQLGVAWNGEALELSGWDHFAR
ncbi:MAG: thiamine-phosphate kinase [Candidatus Cybelea sp.]